jgi:hypothetical protein
MNCPIGWFFFYFGGAIRLLEELKIRNLTNRSIFLSCFFQNGDYNDYGVVRNEKMGVISSNSRIRNE